MSNVESTYKNFKGDELKIVLFIDLKSEIIEDLYFKGNLTFQHEKEIDRLDSLRKVSQYKLHGNTVDILTIEREAVGAALDIFSGSGQLRKEVLGSWAPNPKNVTDINEYESEASLVTTPGLASHFLSGLPTRYINEESAIQHDLFNWEGMTPFHEAGMTRFIQGDRQLDVIYANRNDLEKTLGVDLIYYNQLYSAFVLVQYNFGFR